MLKTRRRAFTMRPEEEESGDEADGKAGKTMATLLVARASAQFFYPQREECLIDA